MFSHHCWNQTCHPTAFHQTCFKKRRAASDQFAGLSSQSSQSSRFKPWKEASSCSEVRRKCVDSQGPPHPPRARVRVLAWLNFHSFPFVRPESTSMQQSTWAGSKPDFLMSAQAICKFRCPVAASSATRRSLSSWRKTGGAGKKAERGMGSSWVAEGHVQAEACLSARRPTIYKRCRD